MSAPVCLVEVPVQRRAAVPLTPHPRPVRLVVGSLYRIELERDFDAEALDRLLQFLERR